MELFIKLDWKQLAFAGVAYTVAMAFVREGARKQVQRG